MNWLTGGRKAQLMQTIIQMQYMHQMLKSAQIMQTVQLTVARSMNKLC